MAQITFTNTGGIQTSSNLRTGGTKDLASAWDAGLIAGVDGHDKVVASYLASSTYGATIGGHNSNLTAWAALNIAGTSLNFRIEETTKMTLNSSGNLGINTTSPAYKLDVNGDIRSQSKTYIGTGGAYIQYNATAGTLDFYC